jgi:hypothetical protein
MKSGSIRLRQNLLSRKNKARHSHCSAQGFRSGWRFIPKLLHMVHLRGGYLNANPAPMGNGKINDKSNRNGNCPTQANRGLEWATRQL